MTLDLLGIERAHDWALYTTPWMDELELFLHPDDHETHGRLSEFRGMPVRASIGVPPGTVLIFDRRRLKYFRRGEQP